MTRHLSIIGIKSPLVVDYEETAARLGLEQVSLVGLDDISRALNRDRVMRIEKAEPGPFVPCAFSPIRRKALCQRAEEAGFAPAEPLLDPTAILARSSRVDLGTYVNAGVVIGGATMIGAFALINRSASMGHHCVIGDFASLGPGVVLAGNVKIHTAAIIGAGAVILPDVSIGESAVVAAGSVVRRDVAAGDFVAGNPAREKAYDRNSSIFATSDEE